MIALAQDIVEQREEAGIVQRRVENFLVNVLDEIGDFNSVTEPASFVADAASSTVISACHRYLDYDTPIQLKRSIRDFRMRLIRATAAPALLPRC